MRQLYLVIRDGEGRTVEKDKEVWSRAESVAIAHLAQHIASRRAAKYTVARISDTQYRTVSPTGEVQILSLETERP